MSDEEKTKKHETLRRLQTGTVERDDEKSDGWFVASATAGGEWNSPNVPRLLVAGPWPRTQAEEWLRKTRQRFINISSGLMHENEVKALEESEFHRTAIKRVPS